MQVNDLSILQVMVIKSLEGFIEILGLYCLEYPFMMTDKTAAPGFREVFITTAASYVFQKQKHCAIQRTEKFPHFI